MENKPILIYHKTTERVTRKMIIPKKAVEKFGNEYYMELYEDYIKLVPIKKKEGE